MFLNISTIPFILPLDILTSFLPYRHVDVGDKQESKEPVHASVFPRAKWNLPFTYPTRVSGRLDDERAGSGLGVGRGVRRVHEVSHPLRINYNKKLQNMSDL